MIRDFFVAQVIFILHMQMQSEAILPYCYYLMYGILTCALADYFPFIAVQQFYGE